MSENRSALKTAVSYNKRERGVNAAYIRTEHDWKNHSRQPSGTYVHGETS